MRHSGATAVVAAYLLAGLIGGVLGVLATRLLRGSAASVSVAKPKLALPVTLSSEGVTVLVQPGAEVAPVPEGLRLLRGEVVLRAQAGPRFVLWVGPWRVIPGPFSSVTVAEDRGRPRVVASEGAFELEGSQPR